MAFTGAGADAASDYDAAFRQIIQNDPDIQAVIQRVWGTGPRPSDTPKNLEKANHQASQEIGQILKAKGIDLPDRTFINPRSGTIEGHRGWKGLSGIQKAAIIAAAAVATGGAGLALAGGGAAAGGAAGAGAGVGAGGGAGLGVTSGLGSLAGVGATGIGAGGTAAGLGTAGAGLGVTSGLGGLANVGATGVTAGGGSGMGLGSSILGGLKTAAINKGKELGGSLLDNLLSGRGLSGLGEGLGAVGQTQAHNRGAKLEAMLAADEMGLAADRERRADESGILKQSQIANYIKGGGFQDQGPGISASGKPFTKFDFGVRPSTEAEKDMAGTLDASMMERLKNPRKLRDYDSQMDPSGWERFNNIAGPVLSGIGAANQPNTSPLQQILQKLTTQPATPGQPTATGAPTANPAVPAVPIPQEPLFNPGLPNLGTGTRGRGPIF